MQEQQRAEQHDTVNAFHAHLQHAHSGRRAGSAAGIIWLLILLHLAFIGYWSESRLVGELSWSRA